jgi:hypothetical protein
MSLGHGTSIVRSGLVLNLDAANPKSYPGSGTAWSDLSGGSNNGTLVNTPTYSSNNKGSFAFNGTNQYATCSGTPLNVTNYTKIVWFKLSSLAFTNNIVSGGSSHFMFFNATNKMYNGHADWASFVAYPSTATFSTEIWYHAALTFNTTDGMVLYVNGFQDSTYTVVKTQAPNSGIIEIAAYASSYFLNGNVGQALIYNRTLTALEVRQNFEALRGRYGV